MVGCTDFGFSKVKLMIISFGDLGKMAGDRVVPTGPGLASEFSEATARRQGWIGEALYTVLS
jgi:hypothetical protein